MFNRWFLKDAAERAVKTFLEVFLSLVVIGGSLSLDVSTAKSAALAAAGAAISVVVSMLSSLRGDSKSASVLE